jgi:Predicted nucleic acid-binding protein, contains PIN domain
MVDKYVLDSFALMALFQDEPGAARVQGLLESADKEDCELYVSVINLGEVLYNVEGRGIRAAQEVLSFFKQSQIKVIDADLQLVMRAARLKAQTGIGYADCFASALAQQISGTVVTGDEDFRRVEQLVPVEWLPVA